MEQPINESDVSMRVTFNEISFQPFVDSGQTLYQEIESVLKNYTFLEKEFGYNHIIAPNNVFQCLALDNQNVAQWFNNLNTPQKNKVSTLFMRTPFSDEVLADKTSETERHFFECDDPIIEQDNCKGLSTAYLLDIPTISIGTHDIWTGDKVSFFEYNDDMTEISEISVLNISSVDVRLNQELISYSEANYQVILVESTIPVEEKPIKLSGDHHGNDKLKALALRMVRNQYIDGVINNLRFERHSSRFIRNIYPNGIVEITMHWEDDGYGMAIQTTGRNLRETEEIAKILRREYDK